ncbi:photosystem II biogenesis protein Psp29 [cyanobiont of Ornithocercus magnificus]|nr:photosystem II biogenesis protein Psp29 [cyanobiont of Ornithocercus magnificus]
MTPTALRSTSPGTERPLSTFQTISDSKHAFHKAFTHVIPSLYRRTSDELLVELHLLSHQSDFRVDGLFAVGLRQVFDAFTRGYRPAEHLDPLFDALCTSNGFDPAELKSLSEPLLQAVRGKNLSDVQRWLQKVGEDAPEPLASLFHRAEHSEFYYSRLMAVGLLTLLGEAQGEDCSEPDNLRQIAHDLAESLGFSRSRVEKDLSLYTANIEKMAQAVELMEEAIATERRKRGECQDQASNEVVSNS